jgi:hypothetical protein
MGIASLSLYFSYASDLLSLLTAPPRQRVALTLPDPVSSSPWSSTRQLHPSGIALGRRRNFADLGSRCSNRPAPPISLSRLRVVRQMEPGINPSMAGRMVISGRMADVCAELEKMALREAGGQHA